MKRYIRYASSLSLAFIAACSGSGSVDGGTTNPPPAPPPPPAPAMTMTIAAGQNQTANWGDTVPIRPAVLVVDTAGHPVSGVAVTFAVGLGGFVTAATPVTGADGVATAGLWTPGQPTGAKQLTASASGVGGSPVQFFATSVAMAQFQKFSGYDQSAPVRTAVLDIPSIQVNLNNAQGASPMVGAVVTFTVTAGGGTVTGAKVTTDNYGVAQMGSWTLGPVPGINKLSANVAWPGSKGVTFTATGTP